MYSYFEKFFFKMFPNLDSETMREEWAKKQLSKIPKGQSLIDVGAGEMKFKKYSNHLKYISQDLGEYEGNGDKIGLQTGTWNASKVDIVSDINSIPVKDASFNNALCTAVLEHVPYPDLAVGEMSRILKKKGKLILDAPFCSQTHFSPYFFCTGFGKYWYKQILTKYKLKILVCKPYGNYFDYLALELIRLPMVGIKYNHFGILNFLLYILLFPIVLIFCLLSKYSKGSEDQLCFGYHILAIKE